MENKLLKKLHIKPGYKLLLENAPDNINAILGDYDAIQLSFNSTKGFDALLLFVKNSVELEKELKILAPLLKPEMLFWIAYPKKTSGIASDLGMMEPWDALKDYALRPCASAAISDVWTGLRIKPEALVKVSAQQNAEILKNDYAEYIDVVNKTVTVPVDLNLALHENLKALHHFNQLSYSNQKEYVLWLLTAKLDKTRLARLSKTITLLLEGRKNPTDKG